MGNSRAPKFSGWSVPRDWPDERCYIIGGGPTAAQQDIEALRGRRVIVVNSSYRLAPFAEYCFAGDSRWLRVHEKELKRVFEGTVVTCGVTVRWPGLLALDKQAPPGLSSNPHAVVFRRTSMHAAINLAVLLGVKSIVLIGADGKADKNGKTHHHEPHPWPVVKNCWQQQLDDLLTLREPLEKRGIEFVNASPGSAWGDLCPIVNLADFL